MADDDDFRAFVRERSPALSRHAYLLTGDHQLAEDLLQSALASTFRHWRRLRDDNPEAYLRRALYHQPGELNYLDLSEQVMRSGGVREGDAPFLIGPRLWLKLSVIALGAVAVLLMVRRLHERARTRRVAATPWETTHGPLV